MSGERSDIHQAITDQIVAAIEAGAGEFEMPWHRAAGSTMRPCNVATGQRYQGVNVLSLWIAAETHAFASPVWGTFKQWLDIGHPVRKGERASYGVIYKDIPRREAESEGSEPGTIALARAFALFNAGQVYGYAAVTPTPEIAVVDPIAEAERLFVRSAARITEAGESAYYRPSTDEIIIPPRGLFKGTITRSPTEAFYATLLHELTHWTGAKHRLDRDLSGRFGDASYAMEELIAELGSAYLCGDLGVTPIARPDHAQYLTSWLKVLKADKKAIFTAASMAQRAARYLCDFLGEPSPSLEPRRPSLSDTLSPEPSPGGLS